MMLTNLVRWSAVASAVLGVSMVACGGSPDDGQSSQSSEALCKVGQICGCTRYVNGRCCPIGDFCPPPPPPPYQVTSWSYTTVASASSNPTSCMQNGYAPAASKYEALVEHAPWSNTVDAVEKTQITLMKGYGCSTPIRYSSHRPYSTDPGAPPACSVGADPNSYDYVFMYMQLCPYGTAADQQAIDSVLSGLGSRMMAGECILPTKPFAADFPAHASTKACSMNLPLPPSGYAWAITAGDPTCPSGDGCMVEGSSGGPAQW